MKKIAILGAGLTGPVLAVYLAKRGYDVTVFERRPDPRTSPTRRGKSLNITLCTRGFAALEQIGVASWVRRISVPARGRIIHHADGNVELQPYGNSGEALYSISRSELNRTLVEYAASRFPVDFRFDSKCVGLDPESGTLTFENDASRQVSRTKAHYIVASDGAKSFTRGVLGNLGHVGVAQLDSTHGNKELAIPANARAPWHAEKNALHIWPRGEYMLIAFPNLDGSFTATLHMPLTGAVSYESISTERDLRRLFESSFPDALREMPDLAADYFAHPTIPMVTIRCAPWRYRDKLLLLGDAAHGVFPSFGQGANAGFEDCSILDECLDAHGDDWPKATLAYEGRRKPDTDALADLSEEHFREIREMVGDPAFLLRKRVERKVSGMYPSRYLPLYSLVAFTRTPYAEAQRINREQSKTIDALLAFPDIEKHLDGPEGEARIRAVMEG
jgi:kynurenine 3-monooxygenase